MCISVNQRKQYRSCYYYHFTLYQELKIYLLCCCYQCIYKAPNATHYHEWSLYISEVCVADLQRVCAELFHRIELV